MWRDHWLIKDGQQTKADITRQHWAGHDVVLYEYRVGQKVYTGSDRRSLQNPKYAHVGPGEKTVLYYSRSHPWLSAIDMPQFVGISGLPVAVLAWFLVAGLVAAVVNPKSRWALQLGRRRWPLGVNEPGPQLEGRALLEDVLRVAACGALIVAGMAAIEVVFNALFGRK
jgi:hypothetical protein